MSTFTAPRKDFTQAEKNAFISNLMSLTGAEKAVGTTPSPYNLHGSAGLLSAPGMRADIINAMILPIGIQSRLPVRLSRMSNEVLPILTGQTDSTGTEPVAACDDAPQPGNLKICNQTYGFGRLIRDSQILQADRPGVILNRSEFTDFNLIGNPFTNLDRPQEISVQEGLRSEVGKKMLELYNAWLLDFSPLLYSGNPANTSGNTGYIEYRGYDLLINTGYQDAYTQQACPSADSVIVNFGSSPITGNENQIVTDIVETVAYLNWLALRLGLGSLQTGSFKLALVMRYELFRQLSSIWPCVYMTYRCTFGQSTNATNFVNAEMQVKMRDDMRNGLFDGREVGDSYLLVDGLPIPVIIDDNITESVPAANTFMSDIYFVPLTFAGGRPATYLEYFDLNAPGGMRDVVQNFAPNFFEIIGNGRMWLHRKPPTNECVQIRLGSKPRLILETPFLAARLTNVRYSPPLFHARNPFPDSPYYHVDGGLTTQNAPVFYSPTA